jgi:hypothetical protein
VPDILTGITHVLWPAPTHENGSRAGRPCHILTGITHVLWPATTDENAAARSDKLQFVAD